MKTKRKHLVIAAAVVLVMAAAWLWYTRPIAFERLCPGIDLSQCTKIDGSCSPPNSFERLIVNLTPEDEAFTSLLAQLQDRTFRRSVRGLLSGGGGTHIGWSEKDTNWDIHLYFDSVILPNGEEISGAVIWLSNFFGSVELHYAGYKTWYKVSAADMQQWLMDVQKILTSAAS